MVLLLSPGSPNMTKAMRDKPISLEVFSDDFDEMERQALEISTWGKNVYVKIPWLVEESLALPLSQLKKNILYSPKDMLSLYYRIIYPEVNVPWHKDETGSSALMNLLDEQVTEKSFLDDSPLRKLLAKIKLSNDSLITTKVFYKV